MCPQRKESANGISAVVVGLFLILASCGPVHQNVKPAGDAVGRITRLAVVVPEQGDFTVFYERGKATATGAVLFGLVGAAVSSAHNQSLDGKKAEILRSGIADVSCPGLFRDALVKALAESKKFDNLRVFEQNPDPKEITEFDAVATFRIKQWGFRLVERGEMEKLASFIDLEIRMTGPTGEKPLWDEHDTVIGKGKYLLSEFESDPVLCRREITETAESAGYRIANTLIYH